MLLWDVQYFRDDNLNLKLRHFAEASRFGFIFRPALKNTRAYALHT